MSDLKKLYPVKTKRDTLIDKSKYDEWYAQSIADPDSFWSERAVEHLDWYKPWDKVRSGSLAAGDYKWFVGGTLNVSYNCIDRHVEQGHADQTAIIWEGNDGDSLSVSYQELLSQVSRLANALKERGIKKGDRVCIYMPMIPEAAYAMLACARIGAIHTVVFAGFSAEALTTRILDAQCSLVLTADVSKRGEKNVPLKVKVDEAVKKCASVHTVISVNTADQPTQTSKIDIDYHESIKKVSAICEPEHMDAEDPLFILYTSGSTGKPKGVLHTTGGYLLYAAFTHKYIFDYHENDIYWCTADVGWITGHTYIIYGPLANRATTVMFEGTPTYPSPSRSWEIVDKHQVNILYSTPTTIRTLMAHGDQHVTKHSLKSLQTLGSVGEPINPEAWRWYYEVVGKSECPIVDTWWQTETGGIAIAPLPGVSQLKPGAAGQPFFGITPVIIDDDGNELSGETSGKLVLNGSWPGQLRGLYSAQERFMETYLNKYPGYFITGDGAERDAGGYISIVGRVDDTLNIAGRLLGTAELESALVLHKDIAEAAVVGTPNQVKGWSIAAFVTPNIGIEETEILHKELRDQVSKEVGSFAKPDEIHFVKNLPKTRSGKIMRRLLRKMASGQTDDLGDTSTLANPETVAEIILSLKSKR